MQIYINSYLTSCGHFFLVCSVLRQTEQCLSFPFLSLHDGIRLPQPLALTWEGSRKRFSSEISTVELSTEEVSPDDKFNFLICSISPSNAFCTIAVPSGEIAA